MTAGAPGQGGRAAIGSYPRPGCGVPPSAGPVPRPSLGVGRHMNEMLRCHHCGEVIGVYEPLVVYVDGRSRETSRAREPHAGGDGEPVFHSACARGTEQHPESQ